MSERDAVRKKAEAQLEELQAKIELLKAKAKGKSADAEIRFQSELEDYRVKRDMVKARLKELKDRGEGAWEDVKSGLDKALDELGDAFRKAKSRFD